jgi:Domain of unknown function (DUF397)
MDMTQAAWRKSSYSGGNGGQCVEVAGNLPGVVAVRDSKDKNGPVLTVTPETWRAFVRSLQAGQRRATSHDVV